jgi:hypothetical protein
MGSVVREGALGAESFKPARQFALVAAEQQVQAQVRQQLSVDPGAIDKQASGLRLGGDVCGPLLASRPRPDVCVV